MRRESGQEEFLHEVFPRELEEIRRRRMQLGADETSLEGTPSADLGLVGLSISGGGIRSASFSLGIVQTLADMHVLERVDYLSSVSGGGYTGACISSLLNSSDKRPCGEAFPLRLCPGASEPPATAHLRNGSNYLNAAGPLGRFRVPNLLLRGIVLNLVAFLPAIALAVMLTEVLYETVPGWDALPRGVLPLILVFVALSILFPLCVRLFPGSFSWKARDQYESLLAIPIASAALLLVSVPFLDATRLAIEHSVPQLVRSIEHISARGWWQVGCVALGILLAFSQAHKAPRLVRTVLGKLVLVVIGLLGPSIVFGIYLLLCLWQIDSPYLPVDSARVLSDAARCAGPCLTHDVDTVGSAARDRSPLAIVSSALSGRELGPATRASLRFELEGRGILVDQHTVVRCGPLPCREPAAGSSWRDDPRVWRMGTASLIDSTCKDLTKEDVRAGKARLEPCDYMIRGSEEYLYILGSNLSLLDGSKDWTLLALLLFALGFNRFFLNINITSPHGFYRDRLSRVFLISEDQSGQIHHEDTLKLSELNQVGSCAPYHLINVALNLQGSDDPNLRGRRSDFFFFSKHYVGSDRTGYVPTPAIEAIDSHMNLGTAMAISAAAAAPNMGSEGNRSLVFLMALLNLRLGYWLPNPSWVKRRDWRARLRLASVSPSLILREAIGQLSEQGSHVNLSDGGHLESLGMYPLLRRRCRFIVAIDAEADPTGRFKGLVTTMRFARIDMGISISIDLDPIRPDAQGLSRRRWALGTIRYGDGEFGYLLYVKLSVSGSEPEYVRFYRKEHPAYPHEPTADQFFGEAQFEAYRALGQDICEDMLREVEGPLDLRNLKSLLRSDDPR